ncbi:MAG: hypothetical protein PVG56_05740 [Anaerolineae bacterium]|jgi:hypothetical protein
MKIPPSRSRGLIEWGALTILADMRYFSAVVLRVPLRSYQVEPVHAILDSILHKRGLEFLLVFPRQSGKNEAIAQLLTYLLNLYQRAGASIIYGAVGDAIGLGIERLEQRLDNSWNQAQWRVATKPRRRRLGKAEVIFLSSHPAASTRGQTASHLLIIDETQDQIASHIESVFTPMRAASNATAVYIGTVKTSSDYLWQKKLELEGEERKDGRQRVFFVLPDRVCAENPLYGEFLEGQVTKHGRNHPIVASEYFLEPIDASGGMFPPRRQALMRGDHARQVGPQPGRLYVATVDVAGEDEAATDPVAALARPGRDYTVGTVFEVVYPPPGVYAPGPSYRAVDVFVDHGSKHFEDVPGRPALIHRLHAWLDHWQVAHTIADASGVGQGLVAWFKDALGETRVTGFNFSGNGKKAHLGSAFLSLVETGRFKYWTDEAAECSSSPTAAPAPGDSANGIGALSDAAWFWAQVRACGYEIPPDGRFDVDLRWGVPTSHKTDTPQGLRLTHDDRLLSAALVAELDRLLRTGDIVLGTAESATIPGTDPLADLGEVY